MSKQKACKKAVSIAQLMIDPLSSSPYPFFLTTKKQNQWSVNRPKHYGGAHAVSMFLSVFFCSEVSVSTVSLSYLGSLVLHTRPPPSLHPVLQLSVFVPIAPPAPSLLHSEPTPYFYPSVSQVTVFTLSMPCLEVFIVPGGVLHGPSVFL